jgi:5-formyltetrahydrofolate cyclo-ligase
MKTKAEIRKEIWDLLEKKKVVTFPLPVSGRIPNFIGANLAAQKLKELDAWRKARVIKSNPDSPQKSVREKALRQGKTVYMAVPRLRDERCFIKIDPKKILSVSEASTIKGAFRYGEKVFPEELEKIDLIIVGSVAVNREGAKVGKGGGFSDLEYALAREYGIVDDSTPTVTTVHSLQIVDYEIPMEKHDVPMDYLITNNTIIKTDSPYKKPKGIHRDLLGNKIEEIPILRKHFNTGRVQRKP